MSRDDELTWLGQAGFCLRSAGTTVLLDPFYSAHDKRLTEAPDRERVADADHVLVTHEHVDHLDVGFVQWLVGRRPHVRVVLPEPVADGPVAAVASEQLVPVQPGSTIDLGDVSIEVVPAAHGLKVADGFSDGSGPTVGARFVGYVVRTPTRTYYHSGDSVVTEELIERLTPMSVDVALLPINGRDFFREQRGIVGNMDAREAVEFADAIGAHTLVPMHWDLFRGNTASPGAVLDAVGAVTGLHVLVMKQLQPFVW